MPRTRFVLLWLCVATVLAAVTAAIATAHLWRRAVASPFMEEDSIRAVTRIDPFAHFFGDPIEAKLVIVVETHDVDPTSVRPIVSFAPYHLTGVSETQTRLGSAEIIRYRFSLQCFVAACLTPADEPVMRAQFPPVRIRYAKTGSSQRQEFEVPWPIMRLAGRVTAAELASKQFALRPGLDTLPLFRILSETRAVQWSLVVAAAVLMALAVSFSARFADALFVRERPEVLPRALSPYEIIAAAAAGTSFPDATLRIALDTIADDLREVGSEDLAAELKAFAWPEAEPDRTKFQEYLAKIRAAQKGRGE